MTTTDALFDANLRGLYPKFLKKKCDVLVLNFEDKARQIITGYAKGYNTSWLFVDHSDSHLYGERTTLDFRSFYSQR